MTNQTYFLDSNIWLYMLLTNKNQPEEVQKQVIASHFTQTETIIISTQVIAEVSVNLI
jgi:predicted nucleic acid-binding protein